VPVNAMNSYGAVEMKFHLLIDGIGHLYTSAGLPREKEITLPTEYKAGWAPQLVWTL